MELRGTIAVVTGASAGIGLAASRALIREGARVAMLARTPEKLEAAASSLGPSATPFAVDVTDRDGIRRVFETVRSDLGPPNILVNNAGLNVRGNVAEHPPDRLAKVIETNLAAPIFMSRLALDYLQRPACIVNVASLAGMVPVPGEASYCASKAGLRAFSAAMRDEHAGTGLHVATVSPGPVSTRFLLEAEDEVPDLVFSQPMSSPEQVAAGILDAIRDELHEVTIPASSGPLLAIGYLMPGLRRALTPVMERIGAARKRRWRGRATG